MAVERLSPLEPMHMRPDPEGSYVAFTDYMELRQALEAVATLPCQLRPPAPRGMTCEELPDYSDTLWCVTCKARAALEAAAT